MRPKTNGILLPRRLKKSLRGQEEGPARLRLSPVPRRRLAAAKADKEPEGTGGSRQARANMTAEEVGPGGEKAERTGVERSSAGGRQTKKVARRRGKGPWQKEQERMEALLCQAER